MDLLWKTTDGRCHLARAVVSQCWKHLDVTEMSKTLATCKKALDIYYLRAKTIYQDYSSVQMLGWPLIIR